MKLFHFETNFSKYSVLYSRAIADVDIPKSSNSLCIKSPFFSMTHLSCWSPHPTDMSHSDAESRRVVNQKNRPNSPLYLWGGALKQSSHKKTCPKLDDDSSPYVIVASVASLSVPIFCSTVSGIFFIRSPPKYSSYFTSLCGGGRGPFVDIFYFFFVPATNATHLKSSIQGMMRGVPRKNRALAALSPAAGNVAKQQ